jgi:hypothetical protein
MCLPSSSSTATRWFFLVHLQQPSIRWPSLSENEMYSRDSRTSLATRLSSLRIPFFNTLRPISSNRHPVSRQCIYDWRKLGATPNTFNATSSFSTPYAMPPPTLCPSLIRFAVPERVKQTPAALLHAKSPMKSSEIRLSFTMPTTWSVPKKSKSQSESSAIPAMGRDMVF